LPDLDATIHIPYADQGVLVYGIHRTNEPVELLADFQEQTGVTFPLVRDEGTLSRFAFPAGVGYPYPRDIVVDKNLRVRSIKNSFNPEEMEALIVELLAEETDRR